ncbi:MAG: Gfo/Idh/MocA family oxidoreductase [Bacteroidota bacterium]
MGNKLVNVGIIGGGLMGKESASAFARWFVFSNLAVKPVLVSVCDVNESVLDWYRDVDTVQEFTTDYRVLLKNPSIDVVYIAVPHHLHEMIYIEALESGKDLLAEKPFGMDLDSCKRILEKVNTTGRFVRCSSEFPFLPGAQKIMNYVQSTDLGKILEIKSGFLHSSDLNESKPINWKRMVKFCGEIGVMGDLGMHAVHLPFRLGFVPLTVSAILQNIVKERKNAENVLEPCDTWDNATLQTTVDHSGEVFPMTIEMKRIAPSETNTWYFELLGTRGGIKYSTKEPKTLWTFEYNDGVQYWKKQDLGFESVLPTITGAIFEPGFPDCFMQMLGCYFAEREGVLNERFYCATPEEALTAHKLFDSSLKSHKQKSVAAIN